LAQAIVIKSTDISHCVVPKCGTMQVLSFCLFPILVSASKPNLLLGQRMGETLRKMDPGDAPSVQAELMSDQKGLNNPAVLEATGRMNRRVGGVPNDDICDRDYEAPCPNGWSPAGKKCIAPKAYTGGCKSIEAFDDMDEVQKRQWAQSCNSEWACKDQCRRDYNRLCPDTWTDVGAGFCEAPASLQSDCLSRYKFDVYSIDQKERLASVCMITWPCEVPCAKNYAAQCPDGWSSGDKGMCLAPSSYAGPCDYGLNTTLLDAPQKVAFSSKCAADWPCINSVATAEGVPGSGSTAVQSGPVAGTGEIVSPQ